MRERWNIVLLYNFTLCCFIETFESTPTCNERLGSLKGIEGFGLIAGLTYLPALDGEHTHDNYRCSSVFEEGFKRIIHSNSYSSGIITLENMKQKYKNEKNSSR